MLQDNGTTSQANGWHEYKQRVLFQLEEIAKAQERTFLKIESHEKTIEQIRIDISRTVTKEDFLKEFQRYEKMIEDINSKYNRMLGIGLALIPVSAVAGAIVEHFLK
jgi:hypothetical protein